MPNLTIPITPHGAIVDISVGLSNSYEQSLKSKGKTVPSRVLVHALIDTGASNTCVDLSVLNQLGLNPTGFAVTHTASSGSSGHRCNVYDISLILPHSGPSLIVADLSASEIDLSGQRFEALIGRDVLSRCNLLFMGPVQQAFLYY
jgi:predicted aspartyl protease